MQVNKTIKFVIPASIMKEIDEKLSKRKEIYVYIIHYLLYKPIRKKDLENNKFVPIDKKKLKSIMGCKPDDYIKTLRKYELIEHDNDSIRGKKPYFYRINSKHETEFCFFELHPNTKLFKNIIKMIKIEKTNISRLDCHLNAMYKEFMNLKFNSDAAIKWINTVEDNRKKLSYMIAVIQISDKRFRYLTQHKTNGRIYSNITNLKKELRKYIIGDYVSIDLKNSQPFLLWILLDQIDKISRYFSDEELITYKTIERVINNKDIPCCLRNALKNILKQIDIIRFREIIKIRKNKKQAYFTNLSKYKEWVVNGILYDKFIEKFPGEIDRDKSKKIVFSVLFSPNAIYNKYKRIENNNQEKKIFLKEFPVIYDIIYAFKDKKDKHNSLALYLQKTESNLFIDNIARKLVENKIIPFTIHDSIIVPYNKKDLALTIIKNIFKNEIGVIPTFEIEDL